MLRLASLIDKFSDWTGRLLAPGLAVLVVILTYEVVLRYLLNNPTEWAHETAGLLFVVLLMLGGSYALVHKAHVRVDILDGFLSPRGQAIRDIITSPLLLLICWVLLRYGWTIAWKSLLMQETSSTTWAPVIYPAKIMIAFAALTFTLQVLADLIHSIHKAIAEK